MKNSNQGNFIEKESIFGPDNYKPLPVVLSKAKGVWVWDVDGKKYLDMMSAYSAVSHVILILNYSKYSMNNQASWH